MSGHSSSSQSVPPPRRAARAPSTDDAHDLTPVAAGKARVRPQASGGSGSTQDVDISPSPQLHRDRQPGSSSSTEHEWAAPRARQHVTHQLDDPPLSAVPSRLQRTMSSSPTDSCIANSLIRISGSVALRESSCKHEGARWYLDASAERQSTALYCDSAGHAAPESFTDSGLRAQTEQRSGGQHSCKSLQVPAAWFGSVLWH